MAHCGDENGAGTPVDDPTTTLDVSVEEDVAAATDEDEDENDLHGFDDEERAVTDDHRQHDGVSLRIDDNEPLSKPGENTPNCLVLYMLAV